MAEDLRKTTLVHTTQFGGQRRMRNISSTARLDRNIVSPYSQALERGLGASNNDQASSSCIALHPACHSQQAADWQKANALFSSKQLLQCHFDNTCRKCDKRNSSLTRFTITISLAMHHPKKHCIVCKWVPITITVGNHRIKDDMHLGPNTSGLNQSKNCCCGGMPLL